MLGVLLALLPLAVGISRLRNVHLVIPAVSHRPRVRVLHPSNAAACPGSASDRMAGATFEMPMNYRRLPFDAVWIAGRRRCDVFGGLLDAQSIDIRLVFGTHYRSKLRAVRRPSKKTMSERIGRVLHTIFAAALWRRCWVDCSVR